MVPINFPRHRQYQTQRIDANNAVMALLAGSKLAEAVLRLTEGSSQRLAELFPQVQHVERLNLKTGEARAILADAENHVGAMAIPYVLSIHEDYMVGLCTMLNAAGVLSRSDCENLGPANMHERYEAACNGHFSTDTLRLFHYLRLIRNSQIHYAGRVHNSLATYSSSLVNSDAATWGRVTGNPISIYEAGTDLGLTIFELIATLAISKRLAEEANEMLQTGLPRQAWLDILVEDWAATPRRGNRDMKIRNLFGFARFEYGPLAVTKSEAEAALRAHSIK